MTTPSLAHRINAIKSEIGMVQKTGVNEYHGFRFATHDDILAAVVPLMQKHGVCVKYYGVTSLTRTEATPTRAGKPQFRSEVLVQYVISATEDVGGDGFSVSAPGEAIDAEDKGITKALTSAHKYLYMRLFDIRTGDVEDEIDRHAPTAEPPAALTKVLGDAAAARLGERAQALKITVAMMVSALKNAGVPASAFRGIEESPALWPAEIAPKIKEVLDGFEIPGQSETTGESEDPCISELRVLVNNKWQTNVKRTDLLRPGAPQTPKAMVDAMLADADTWPQKTLKGRVAAMKRAIETGNVTFPDGLIIPF